MITSLIFFDLNQPSESSNQTSLRKLQEHLTSDEEPMNFS